MAAFVEAEFQHLKIELEEIKSATNNFDDAKVIGSGGFGKVYEGEISHSKGRSLVAFKRLDGKFGQGCPEFVKEVRMLSRYTHKNLVSLLGICSQGDEMILVYEHASRGSLDRHLRDANLNWMLRLKICLDAAKGLSFLHDPRGTHQRLIHCDIKSANILLDDRWNAKVSDFGLSKIGPVSQHNSVLVTSTLGTYGYCDPVFMQTYCLTKESDVYSFGVVLFEVLCGRLCSEYSNGQLKVLVSSWKKRYEENKLEEIIFEYIMQKIDHNSLKIFSDIAYKCLNITRKERPTMSLVVKRLEASLKCQKIHDLKQLPAPINSYTVEGISGNKTERGQTDVDASLGLPTFEKESNSRENNVSKIKVVVRKRPLNKNELYRKEDDVVSVCANGLTVHEPKLKQVTNDEVYRETVQPIIPIIFQRTKATCFAYGQTGSGKTYTMQPLPLRAAEDFVRLLHQPAYRNQKFKLWLSYFEIYGGKLYDLLSDRKKLCIREDGRQQVCIVGLQEFAVLDVQIVKEFIERGNAARSTGSTGANEESSRSHAILQLVVKKHNEVKDTKTRRNNDDNESKGGKVVGKISFIDLAGSERGADTTDNDRQTRIEGTEINKSLLALKECIRALATDQLHIPFRGSKLTEVLRDSFVGNSRTVMISCISPNAGSCEQTLNTLRYAHRVKSLSKSGNSKKDQVGSSQITSKDSSSANMPVSSDGDDIFERHQEAKVIDKGRRGQQRENLSYNTTSDFEKQPPPGCSSYSFNSRDDSDLEKEKGDSKNTFSGSNNQKIYSMPSSADTGETVQKASPPRRKSYREDKSEKIVNWQKKDNGDEKSEKGGWPRRDVNNTDFSTVGNKQQGSSITNASMASKHSEPEKLQDENVNEILEGEEALNAARMKEIDDIIDEIIAREVSVSLQTFHGHW